MTSILKQPPLGSLHPGFDYARVDTHQVSQGLDSLIRMTSSNDVDDETAPLYFVLCIQHTVQLCMNNYGGGGRMVGVTVGPARTGSGPDLDVGTARGGIVVDDVTGAGGPILPIWPARRDGGSIVVASPRTLLPFSVTFSTSSHDIIPPSGVCCTTTRFPKTSARYIFIIPTFTFRHPPVCTVTPVAIE